MVTEEQSQGQGTVKTKTTVELETERLTRENTKLTKNKIDKEAYATQLEKNVELKTGLRDVNKRIKDAGGGGFGSINLGILKNKYAVWFLIVVFGTILIMVVKGC